MKSDDVEINFYDQFSERVPRVKNEILGWEKNRKKPRGEKKKLNMQENEDVAAFSRRCVQGSHVLVCADTFDSGGTHYLRSVGLGPTLDTDPPPKTVFFCV